MVSLDKVSGGAYDDPGSLLIRALSQLLYIQQTIQLYRISEWGLLTPIKN